jgi:hypothetical protein
MLSYRIETLRDDPAKEWSALRHDGKREGGFMFSHQAVFTIPLYFANQEEFVT